MNPFGSATYTAVSCVGVKHTILVAVAASILESVAEEWREVRRLCVGYASRFTYEDCSENYIIFFFVGYWYVVTVCDNVYILYTYQKPFSNTEYRSQQQLIAHL